MKTNRESTFFELRQKFPFFAFEKQEIDLGPEGLSIRFTFNLSDQYLFHPQLFIPRKTFFLPDDEFRDQLDRIVFNIGMIELISYWKTACPPEIRISPFGLNNEQKNWWKKLYFNGLGEFFYLNGISAKEDSFVNIISSGQLLPPPAGNSDRGGVILPVGGGKDSVVTLELLKSLPGSIPLIMNPRGASLACIRMAGFADDGYLEIHRTLDPLLLKLNAEGFLNGHTPFSALLAFVTVLASIVSGRTHIALSNESSANEATIPGTGINHQYSKSLMFEQDFREYVSRYVSVDIDYFSFLRPLNELQIASLFSKFTQYHPVFRSCNAGSKTDSWCGACAKCLFTAIILSPFLENDRLATIFGKDMFSDESLLPFLDQLSGVADEKPFDCVGTIREVNLALCETIRQRSGTDLPALLAHYRDTGMFALYHAFDFGQELGHLSQEHQVTEDFLGILQK